MAAISILCFIPAIVVHEVSHGYAALKMGDTTAKDAKRLTFNPLKHIDPFGTVLLPLMLVAMGMPAFGFAKPVPYNPMRFRNMKQGELVVGLAGPASNLVMALISSAFAFALHLVVGMQGSMSASVNEVLDWVFLILFYFTLINLCLMFFNLLPIPPLDGSSIIMPLLPNKAIPTWYKIQRYAFPILILLVVVLPYATSLLGYRIDPLSSYIEFTALNLARLLFSYL